MIELICGPMSSGKTTEMLRRIRRAQIAGIPTIILKPSTDVRTEGVVSTHDKVSVPCFTIPSTTRKVDSFVGTSKVVGVDEIQFFDTDIIYSIERLSLEGIRFVIAGLDLDFSGNPFATTRGLFPYAEEVRKLSAVCVKCGGEAPRSFRKTKEGSTVLVGGLDTYEARCVPCWKKGVDGKE